MCQMEIANIEQANKDLQRKHKLEEETNNKKLETELTSAEEKLRILRGTNENLRNSRLQSMELFRLNMANFTKGVKKVVNIYNSQPHL